MMLYHIIDGAYLGFYREYGGTVFISGYRTLVQKQWIVKDRPVSVQEPDQYEDVEVWIPESTVEEWVLVPEHVEMETRTVEGGWLYSSIWVEGHWESRRYWIEEDCWYEPKTVSMLVLGEMRDVTRNVLVCEPAHWGVRQEWIAGWWKEVSEWEDEHEEDFEVTVRTHYEKHVVTTPGHFETESVLVPGEYVTVMVESGDWEDVAFEDPIYSYYDSRDEYCMFERQRAPLVQVVGEHIGDLISLRITGTDSSVTFYADFICCATSIGENQYVNPG